MNIQIEDDVRRALTYIEKHRDEIENIIERQAAHDAKVLGFRLANEWMFHLPLSENERKYLNNRLQTEFLLI